MSLVAVLEALKGSMKVTEFRWKEQKHKATGKVCLAAPKGVDIQASGDGFTIAATGNPGGKLTTTVSGPGVSINGQCRLRVTLSLHGLRKVIIKLDLLPAEGELRLYCPVAIPLTQVLALLGIPL